MKKLFFLIFLVTIFITSNAQILIGEREGTVIRELSKKYGANKIEILYINDVRTIKVETEMSTNFYAIDSDTCFFIVMAYEMDLKSLVIETLDEIFIRLTKTKWVNKTKTLLIELDEKQDINTVLVSIRKI